MKDIELLREFSARNSEEAFETLARRYTDLVYSAALRQSGDSGSAEEIAQAVFVVLARKAPDFTHDTILSSWLLRTTRFVALNARRREFRRRSVEKQAMSQYCSETDDAWNQIAPILDEALIRLKDRDRDAVVLRFFDQKSYKEIALATGTTEDGAQKRVSRALEKLRSSFVKRGVILPAALATTAITAHAVQASPENLTARITRAAMKGAAVAGLVSTLANLTLISLRTAQLRIFLFRSGTIATVAVLVWLAALSINLEKTIHPIEGGASKLKQQAGIGAPIIASSASTLSESSQSEKLSFHVVDSETQKPVVKARVTLIWTTNYPENITNVVATDREGLCLLPIHRTASREWNCLIEVYRDNYVPKYVSWSERQGDDHTTSQPNTRLSSPQP